ncbi:hypothetical protein X975_26359, partial [Stegodyphus mimosarum]
MATVLCDCENIINKRWRSICPEEPLLLTPTHFLLETPNYTICDTLDFDTVGASHLMKKIGYLQSVRECFLKRFQKDYLSELVSNLTIKARSNIQVGDVVLVGSDNSKRINWPLAKVMEICTGGGGKQRVTQQKLANVEIIRRLQRLYLLEITSSDLTPQDKVGSTGRRLRPKRMALRSDRIIIIPE